MWEDNNHSGCLFHVAVRQKTQSVPGQQPTVWKMPDEGRPIGSHHDSGKKYGHALGICKTHSIILISETKSEQIKHLHRPCRTRWSGWKPFQLNCYRWWSMDLHAQCWNKEAIFTMEAKSSARPRKCDQEDQRWKLRSLFSLTVNVWIIINSVLDVKEYIKTLDCCMKSMRRCVKEMTGMLVRIQMVSSLRQSSKTCASHPEICFAKNETPMVPQPPYSPVFLQQTYPYS